jgi:zinc transport system substrate-binding protein
MGSKKRLLPHLILPLLTIAALSLSSCSKMPESGRIAIVGGPAYAIVSEIAEPDEIIDATPKGGDPHYMELTPSLAKVIEQSIAIISLGASTDSKIVKSFDKPTLMLVPQNANDPHMWLSPRRVAQWVPLIETFLDQCFPQNRTQHAKKAETFLAQLARLDQEFSQLKGMCFVSQHPAFSYVAEDYGWKIVANLEVGEAELSPRRLSQLIGVLSKEKNCVLLLNPYEPSKTAQTLQQQLGLASANFDLMETTTMPYTYVMNSNLEHIKQVMHP